MNFDMICVCFDFLCDVECLKDVLCSGYMLVGCVESMVEYSWWLCLMVFVFVEVLFGVDMLKLLKLCVVYDFGEVLYGDIFVIEQVVYFDKSVYECDDLLMLIVLFDCVVCDEIVVLWDEYEVVVLLEVCVVKVFDKFEMILQYNQGSNLFDFDYVFNFGYGWCYIDVVLLFSVICEIVDVDMQCRIDVGGQCV